MAHINFKLENQLLTQTNEVILSSGDSGTDTCSFEFDENWDGYIKTAVFYQEKDAVQYAILDENGTCTIPAAAMSKAGIMCVGVFGVKSNELLTSTVEKVEVLQGSADSEILDLEPTDDVFLSIVAQYHEILNRCNEIEVSYEEIIELIKQQNAILETLNAFDVEEINERLSEIELDINTVLEIGKEVEKNFRIDNVTVSFDENGVFTYVDDRITEQTLCEVFFDTLCIDSASAAIVSVETFEGYIKFSTTYSCSDVLTCSIYCMGV